MGKKLHGYLNFYINETKKIVFVRPIFTEIYNEKTSNDRFFRLSFYKYNDDEFGFQFLEVDQRYIKSNNMVNDISGLSNRTNINFQKPHKPLFMAKIGYQLFFGTAVEILESIFEQFDFKEIKLFDPDYLLMRFMLRNFDNKYLGKYYLPSCENPDLIKLVIELINTEKLEDEHKDFLLDTINKNKNILARIKKEDINLVKSKIEDNSYRFKILDLINVESEIETFDLEELLTQINMNKSNKRKEFQDNF